MSNSPILVKLTNSEIFQAAMVGVMRHTVSLQQGNKNRHGASIQRDNDWQIDIEGALGERAAAKALNMYWQGSVNKQDEPDVGDLEVRTTSYSSGHLIVRNQDDDDAIFVLVTGQNGLYTVRGWIKGEDAKSEEYLKERGDSLIPAYFVPASKLRSIDELNRGD